MKTNLRASFFLALTAVVMSGCAHPGGGLHRGAPKSFSMTRTQPWSMIELRSDIEYKRAWDTVLDILVKSFEIDKAIREEGYILTGWVHTWSGDYLANYRVRITIKFSPDRANLQFLPEAQFLHGDKWIIGTDTRLVSTIRTDLMGTVGRTTR